MRKFTGLRQQTCRPQLGARANADSVNARAEPPYYADVSYRSITTQAVQIMLFCTPTPGVSIGGLTAAAVAALAVGIAG